MYIKLADEILAEKKNTFQVQSFSDPNWKWLVKKTKRGWICDCPGYTFHRKPCKHIKYIIGQQENLKNLGL